MVQVIPQINFLCTFDKFLINRVIQPQSTNSATGEIKLINLK